MPQENKFNLSIIIPVFNEERYLNKLFLDLKQYFNQENIEVIVVNDQSIDKTSSYTITEETLHLSSVISKSFIQQTKHNGITQYTETLRTK